MATEGFDKFKPIEIGDRLGLVIREFIFHVTFTAFR
jgi:hypothetical protein